MITFVAYSDIHYHHYTNGLTLADVETVENQVLDSAITSNADFILFGGDRYMSRNPMYEAALASDRMIKKISDSGIPLFILVGNHDRLTKNDFKMHTMNHVGMYAKDLPNVTIMDERKAYEFTTKRGAKIAIHAVPAGHEPTDFIVDKKNFDFNLCVFHAIILGSLYHNGTLADGGLSVASFDNKGFDLVLAGDNHKRQELPPMNSCPGAYIGAPMQHNWGDEGAERGFMKVTSSSSGPTYQWIDTKSPKFMKVNWNVSDLESLILAAKNSVSDWGNNIIRLDITGPSIVLNSINLDDWKANLTNASKARAVDIKLKYDTTVAGVVTLTPASDTEEWVSFLSTKSADLDKADVAYLEKLGIKYITHV